MNRDEKYVKAVFADLDLKYGINAHKLPIRVSKRMTKTLGRFESMWRYGSGKWVSEVN